MCVCVGGGGGGGTLICGKKVKCPHLPMANNAISKCQIERIKHFTTNSPCCPHFPGDPFFSTPLSSLPQNPST